MIDNKILSYELGKIVGVIELRGFVNVDICDSVENICNEYGDSLDEIYFKQGLLRYARDNGYSVSDDELNEYLLKYKIKK
jgi:hypothetical protein